MSWLLQDEDADPGAAAEDDTVGDDTAEANTAAATADTNGTPLNSALGDKAMQKASAGILIGNNNAMHADIVTAAFCLSKLLKQSYLISVFLGTMMLFRALWLSSLS